MKRCLYQLRTFSSISEFTKTTFVFHTKWNLDLTSLKGFVQCTFVALRRIYVDAPSTRIFSRDTVLQLKLPQFSGVQRIFFTMFIPISIIIKWIIIIKYVLFYTFALTFINIEDTECTDRLTTSRRLLQPPYMKESAFSLTGMQRSVRQWSL